MRKLILTFGCVVALVTQVAGASNGMFDPGMTSGDARYGSVVGAAARWAPAYAPASRASASVGFGGNVALSCSGIDFQGFLSQFKPNELLSQMKDTLISGAQSAVSSYLIMMAYSNPTIASVLDMMDKKYSARFDSFAQACNAQQAKRQGQDLGARRMAEAQDQCFAQQVQSGSSPNEAFRVCSAASTFGSFDLPAMKQTSDFLKRYTSLNMTSEMAGLMKLLPDEQIDSGGMKMRPAALTTMQMYSNLETRSRAAIQAILGGQDPSAIPECKDGDFTGSTSAAAPCLPATASNIVASPTFLSARLLTPPAAQLYTSAMSSQIATTAMYSNIYELKQQISQMDVKDSSGASAEEVIHRREALLKSVDSLQREADALRQVQESRNRVAKTQILTLQKAQEDLAARAAQGNDHPVQNGFTRLIRIFM